MDERGIILFLFFFLAAFICVGIYLMFSAITAYCDLRNSKQWYKTKATVIDCRIGRISGKRGPQHWVEFEYEYFVGSNKYLGDNIAFGYEKSQANDFHIKLYELLKQKKEVSIWYDSQSPEKSVLVKMIASTSITNFVGGLTFLLFPLSIILILGTAKFFINTHLIGNVFVTVFIVHVILFIIGFIYHNISNTKINRAILEEVEKA